MFRAAAPGRGSHSDDLVLVVGGEDGLHCLLGREGSLAEEAGAGVSFAAYSHCFLNNLAEALYGAVYAGPGITTANRTAVYFGRYDAAHESLRDANPAPTFPTGVSLRSPP